MTTVLGLERNIVLKAPGAMRAQADSISPFPVSNHFLLVGLVGGPRLRAQSWRGRRRPHRRRRDLLAARDAVSDAYGRITATRLPVVPCRDTTRIITGTAP